jgi:hypothetical protein
VGKEALVGAEMVLAFGQQLTEVFKNPVTDVALHTARLIGTVFERLVRFWY